MSWWENDEEEHGKWLANSHRPLQNSFTTLNNGEEEKKKKKKIPSLSSRQHNKGGEGASFPFYRGLGH